MLLPIAYVVRREGYVFTPVCLSAGGGGGGYPGQVQPGGGGGLPHPALDRGGTPAKGVPPPRLDGGTPPSRDGVPPCTGQQM